MKSSLQFTMIYNRPDLWREEIARLAYKSIQNKLVYTNGGQHFTENYIAYFDQMPRIGNIIYQHYCTSAENYDPTIDIHSAWLADPCKILRDIGIPNSNQWYLVRTDPQKNYTPANCYWKSARSTKLVLEIDGAEISLRDACEQTGINYHTAYRRIKRGWPTEAAINPEIKQCPST